MKLLVFAAVGYAIYYFFFRKGTPLEKSKKGEDEVMMVECSSCKTYIASDEAIVRAGKYYCSQACAEK